MQATNEGSYQVVISNSAGAVTSSAGTFTRVLPPQIISTTPALGTDWITNGTGSSISVPLTIVATNADESDYPLSYQWNFHGTNIPGWIFPTYSILLPPYWSGAVPLEEGNYAVTVTNAAGATNVGTWNIRVLLPGMVAAWGDDAYGESDRPVTLTNTMALAAGQYQSVAVTDSGSIVQWGNYWTGGTNFFPVGSPPTNANLVAVSAGIDDAVALKSDGTVIEWGLSNSPALANLPTNLAGVKAVSAGWYRNLALLTNGTIVDWGFFAPTLGFDQRVPVDLTNATAIACGAYHNLAVRGDGTVGSWGYDASGQTNVPVGLSNVVAVAGGGEFSLALKVGGTVVAWGDNSHGQCNVPAGLSNVLAIAAGYFHSVALKNDGTVVSWGDNTYGETNVPNTLSQIKLIAAGGYHTLATMFSPMVQYPQIDVTKDLLLIYNLNSADSSNVCAYYLAHRPMVANANVLGVACDVGEFFVSSNNCDAQLVAPVLNWLTNNPTKHPEYIVLFYDIPTRLSNSYPYVVYGSVSYHLRQTYPGWPPFVNNINAGSAADCEAYVDKLAYIGTNYSPGKLIISAGAYGNTNYVLDGIRYGGPPQFLSDFSGYDGAVSSITNGLLAAGIPAFNIIFSNGLEVYSNNAVQVLPHPTGITNVAGYISWGEHSSLQIDYATNGAVKWFGNSGWWIITTVESFNGQNLQVSPMGNFVKWFSANAFGGTNYSNTPVGAISTTEEPSSMVNGSIYFGLWATGRNFGICSWNAMYRQYFQAIGDPLVTR